VVRAGSGEGGEGDSEKPSPPRRAPPPPPQRRPANPKRVASSRFSAEAQTWALLGGTATVLTIICALFVMQSDNAASLPYFGGADDFSYMGDDYQSNPFTLVSPANVFAAAVWSFGCFYKSPLQILLVFLGRTDTERPSDWMLKKFAPGNPKTFEDASVVSKVATVVFFIACGCGITKLFDLAFSGEETWAISAGIGFTMLSFIAELGSPTRYNKEEIEVLEAQFADFKAFADISLERKGRCHTTEVSRAFRRKFPRYGDEAVLSDKDLRTMILNWHPNADRTSSGYYKSLSLKVGVDQRSAVTVKDLGL